MLAVENLRKSFDSKIVLDGLNFTIEKGELYGLLGPNGAGKTTAINILCGLLKADEGMIRIAGKPPSELTKSLLGVVPQEISVYKDLTCKENLVFFSRIYGLSRYDGIAKAEELIDLFRLEEYANTEVHKLSGGWQRRVNIAVALVHSPTILFLDEPTAGLDIEARFELWKLMDHLKSKELAILLTTHILDEAQKLCSRIGIIQEGKIVAEGSLDELRKIVPAVQLAFVRTENENLLRKKATSFGWEIREYAGKLTLCLPEIYQLNEIVSKLADVPISAISLHEVGLEQAYLEITKQNLPENIKQG
ncbi:MAG: ABC transporter ATP-binding protein [Bacteroidales bacterium]|nr:ABC transporter ATP-binding protein [Bacteroidales bacterium]